MAGRWVFVCGPSGAGKDSVIGWAREALTAQPRYLFAQRLVTRPGLDDAAHRSMDAAAFERLHQGGGLAWHWQAHGWRYGIARHYAQAVSQGQVVIVNGSREHVAAHQPPPALQVVLVASDPQALAARLQGRGRDDAGAIAQRLARNALLGEIPAACRIVNDGPLEAAGSALTDFLHGL